MPAVRMIFVGVSGSPGSVHALRYAADLARHHDAILVPLLSWVPPCGDLDERKHPSLQHCGTVSRPAAGTRHARAADPLPAAIRICPLKSR